MCGIAGIFSDSGIANIGLRISKMCESMKSRGPNASGTVVLSNRVALGHRRLSIIDLNVKSNQPMLSSDGKYYLVFNGEIVNYIELRKKLKYKFNTDSDTEVILAAICEKGLEWFLEHANGMFALCLYDVKNNEMYLARDRFGIKPIYYSISEKSKTFVFASDINGILASGLVEGNINYESFDEYLAYRYTREPYTFFKEIYKLPHGSYLHIKSYMNFEVSRYYNIPKMNFSENCDEKALIENLENKINTALKKWTIADVKVGSYLSGGVDSSLLTAMYSKNCSELDTYTIGFENQKTNEFSYAQTIADMYKTNHRAFLIDFNEFENEWNELIQYKGSPLGVPNEIPLSIMTSRLAKDITVVISGEGADELFGGYGRIFRSAFDFENSDFKYDFYNYFIEKYEYAPRKFRNKFLNMENYNIRKDFDSIISNEFINYDNRENIFRFFHNYHIQGLLERLDTCSMKSSIEARPPFLDNELIDYVYKEIPYCLKLKWNDDLSMKKCRNMASSEYSELYDTPKYILKKVSEKYLPNEIIYRKKMGFPIPLNDYKDVMIKKYYENLKNEKWLKIDNDKVFLEELNCLHNSGQVLWMLINLMKFCKKYENQEFRY
ncbi:MAG: asparagine synthase (glutamine-hydrolyzing) [Clostridium neonatale]